MKKQNDINNTLGAQPMFDVQIGWKTIQEFLRPSEWDFLTKRMSELSAQNTDALKEFFLLGFRAGLFFAEDTYEKERQK